MLVTLQMPIPALLDSNISPLSSCSDLGLRDFLQNLHVYNEELRVGDLNSGSSRIQILVGYLLACMRFLVGHVEDE
jgi:hypothetical protein